MDNIFKTHVKRHSVFAWGRLGDIEAGRGSLGTDMKVLVYRMMQYSLMDVLASDVGPVKANHFFREAGKLAGFEFAMHNLTLEDEFEQFIARLQAVFLEYRLGKVTLESHNPENGDIVFLVEEDLDCSGLEPTDESICHFDEGLLAGIMEAYTGEQYRFEEVECWGTGTSHCRFEGTMTRT